MAHASFRADPFSRSQDGLAAASNFQPHVGSGHKQIFGRQKTQRKNGIQNFEIDCAHLIVRHFFEINIWKLGNTVEFLLSIAWRSSRSSLLPAWPVKRPLFEAPCARKQNQNNIKPHQKFQNAKKNIINVASNIQSEAKAKELRFQIHTWSVCLVNLACKWREHRVTSATTCSIAFRKTSRGIDDTLFILCKWTSWQDVK